MLIDRRRFALGSLTALGSLAGCSLQSRLGRNRSYNNFLFLIIDDLNDWVTASGPHPQVKTPNIDALASRGTVFVNAHAQAPICGPSRASFLSGLYPAQTGIYGQIPDADLGPAVAAASPTLLLPQYLGANGYHTAARGKISHQGAQEGMFKDYVARPSEYGPSPETRFKWFDPRTHTDWGAYPESDAEMQDFKSAIWGAEFLKRDHEQPFMLALGFIRPHVPWYVPRPWLDKFPLDQIEPPSVLEGDLEDIPAAGRNLVAVPQMPTLQWARENDEWRPMLQAYLASIAFVDHCVGIVIDSLQTSGLMDRTLVCLASDNGYHMGEKQRFAKMSLWERSTRVPLVFSGPDIVSQVVSDQVGLIDIYPTVLDMLQLPPNAENAGRSLGPVLTATNTLSPQPQISTFGRGNFAVIDERYRYIRYANGIEELYDHELDPMEWHNRASEDTYNTVKQRLARHIPPAPAPDVLLQQR